MSVQGISASTNRYATNTQNSSSSLSGDFKALITAIQSGDLSGAQSAFSQIQGLLGSNTSVQPASSSQSSGSQTQFSVDFAALGNALQSGDMSGAQDALKKLGQDLQSTGKAHHHHHHHGGSAPTENSTSTTDPSNSNTTSGTNVNLTL